MSEVNYNERSWAIDLISQINLFLSGKNLVVKWAGGENTISENGRRLFPDVLLYGDQAKGTILQGWELKMPDTSITDEEFIHNAEEKARALGLSSFLIWNVRSAILYRLDEESESYKIHQNWGPIAIATRGDVNNSESIWKTLLEEILYDLNDLFSNNTLSSISFIEAVSLDVVTKLIASNLKGDLSLLKQKSSTDGYFDAAIDIWWNGTKSEYAKESDKYEILARVIKTDWVFKFLFANLLKKHFNPSRQVEDIVVTTSPEKALEIFAEISNTCNFWNIFSKNLGQNVITPNSWNGLVQFNQFLVGLHFEAIEDELLHELLQKLVISAKRKLSGQFATPPLLADLLVRLTIIDKTGNVFDPFCGTGTIAKAASNLQSEYNISASDSIKKIWASDKYAFPVQLASISLTKPENIGEILRVFKSDVIDLSPHMQIPFKDPNTGESINGIFPMFRYIVSNPPFIQQEQVDPSLKDIMEWVYNTVNSEVRLSGRSDFFAFVPFYIWRLMQKDGRIGLVLSNAYLGTEYGKSFLHLVQWFYQIKHIVVSGNGKWFKNADIVTTLFIADKKPTPSAPIDDESISFNTLLEKLEKIPDLKNLSSSILLAHNNNYVRTNKYSNQEIKFYDSIGFSWSSLFTDISWLKKVKDKLVHVSEFFELIRGERRGWNQLFYPSSNHGIEPEFIKPVLKNLRNAESLICNPNKQAFCCSLSMEDLRQKKAEGAINWISRFRNQTNKVGVPLPEALSRPNQYWYEMRADTMADFVANINFDQRLFIARLSNRSFVDQRLIGFSLNKANNKIDKDLLLALMNSMLGLFFIESLGFGRGLGALDLSKDKFERGFMFWNPTGLSFRKIWIIIKSFEPISNRLPLPIPEELESPDRISFEKSLAAIFDYDDLLPLIKKSLLDLYHIRKAIDIQ